MVATNLNFVGQKSISGDSVGQMRKEMREKQKEGERLSEQIESLERKISQLRCGYEYDSVKRYGNRLKKSNQYSIQEYLHHSGK